MKQVHPLDYLKYSYELVQGAAPTNFSEMYRSIETFFKQPHDYKNQFIDNTQLENGYRQLAQKEILMIRDDRLFERLPLEPLLNHLHQFCLNCLESISHELELSPEKLFNLVDKKAITPGKLSPSLFRIVNYFPEQSCNATDIHQDLGLLTVVCYTNVPALEIYDYVDNTGWIDIEAEQKVDDLVVMVGESLAHVTNNYFLPATHRVRAPAGPRLACIYHLRLKPDALLDSSQFETAVTGRFSTPFRHTAEAFMRFEMSQRSSVNGSY